MKRGIRFNQSLREIEKTPDDEPIGLMKLLKLAGGTNSDQGGFPARHMYLLYLPSIVIFSEELPDLAAGNLVYPKVLQQSPSSQATVCKLRRGDYYKKEASNSTQ